MISIQTNSETGTQALAAALARLCSSGDCVLLEGDLGAGKTSFARGFIGELAGEEQEVLSPSFMLVLTYPVKHNATLWHFDLYRLKAAEELREIGLEEALSDGITLIEWPDRAEGWLPETALKVRIGFGEHEHGRVFSLSSSDASWAPRLQKLKDNA